MAGSAVSLAGNRPHLFAGRRRYLKPLPGAAEIRGFPLKNGGFPAISADAKPGGKSLFRL
jgi:hypothetical protein